MEESDLWDNYIIRDKNDPPIEKFYTEEDLSGLSVYQRNALLIKKRHGDDFFARIGRKGGKATGTGGGFACKRVGADGLTGAERAKIAGAKGGRKSKRGKESQANEQR